MYPPVELDDLTSGERDAVTLVYFEHFTVKQAALALMTDVAGIGRHLSRAYALIATQVMTPDAAPGSDDDGTGSAATGEPVPVRSN